MNKTSKKSRAVQNMTTGNPMPLILGFALPMFGGMLFQQFYNLVDTLIVGRFLGVDALAGVGSTGSINFLIIGFVMGITAGFSIPISQRYGAEDYSQMRGFFVHSLYLSALFAVIMTTAVCLLCGRILTAMDTPENIYQYAYDYIFIIFAGIPATFLFNLTSGAIRALGDSKAPVVFLVISSLLNISLDLILILIFHLGVSGAAIATIFSQTAAGILCLLYMMKRIEILQIHREDLKYKSYYTRILLSMGVPMGLQYSITAIGSVILQTAVNGLGSDYVAAQTAGGKVSMFFAVPYEAIGATMATYGGQNVGAGRPDRLNQGLKAASILGLGYAAAAFVILYFFGEPLTAFFLTDANPSVAGYGRTFLVVNAAFYCLLHFVNGVRFLIQGMGYSAFAIIAGICELFGRTAAALILIPRIGFLGACLASPIAWLFADLFLFPAYFHVRRKIYHSLGMDPGK